VRIVVQEWERMLVYKDGRFQEILDPGLHRRPRRRLQVRVPVRPRLVVVPAQEVLTADGLSVRISLALAVRTADPRRWFEAVENADSFVYSAVQIALRDLMVPAELRRAAAEVATARAQGQAVLERARSEVAATRALANAARMIAEQPALLQLRTLQAVEAGGATVVLTQGSAPVPGTPPQG